jgi:hypothetical protein
MQARSSASSLEQSPLDWDKEWVEEEGRGVKNVLAAPACNSTEGRSRTHRGECQPAGEKREGV